MGLVCSHCGPVWGQCGASVGPVWGQGRAINCLIDQRVLCCAVDKGEVLVSYDTQLYFNITEKGQMIVPD